MRHRMWENLPTLGKSATNFEEIRHPLWEKSATGFWEIRHRLWGNPSAIFEKNVTDFGKMNHRLWENQPPALGKSATDFGKSVFGRNMFRLWGKTGSVLGEDWLGFRERLARFGGKSWFGESWFFGLACDKAQVSLF